MSMTCERATVLTSVVVAIAILGAAVTAQTSRTSRHDQLARLESDLRYQLELGARVDRSAHETRMTALEETIEAWRNCSQSANDYELMTEWLRTTLTRSLPGESADWPATPSFSEPRHIADKVVIEDAAEAQARQDEADVREAEAPALKAGKAGQVAPPVASRGTQKDQAMSVAPRHDQPSQAQRNTLREATGNSEPPPKRAGRQAAAVPPGKFIRSSEPTPTSRPAEIADRSAPTAVQAAKAYSATPIKAVAAQQIAAPGAQLNLAELNARIGGYHDGLREIEAAVVARREGMTLRQVANLVGRLEELAGHYEFVQLYYAALTRDERHFVAAPRSMASIVDLVDQQRVRAESAREDDHFSPADALAESELAQRLKLLKKPTNE